MMEREWQDILARYGQAVTLRRGEAAVPLRALVQPLLDRGRDQEVPSSLGLGRTDCYLYLGPAGCPIDTDTLGEWGERNYRVRSAHMVGEGVCPYWRAILCPRDEVAL